MNTPSAEVDVFDFDPETFGRHLASEVDPSGDVEAQIQACASIEDGLRFLWRLTGIASAEIEARTEAWCEAFRVQLGRQTVAVVGAIKEARASTKH